LEHREVAELRRDGASKSIRVQRPKRATVKRNQLKRRDQLILKSIEDENISQAIDFKEWISETIIIQKNCLLSLIINR